MVKKIEDVRRPKDIVEQLVEKEQVPGPEPGPAQDAEEQPLEFEDIPAADRSAVEVVETKEKEEEEQPNPTLPDATRGGAPPWVVIPPGMKFPRGAQVIFCRFPSRWTPMPWKGSPMPDEEGLWRQCIIWEVNIGDKKMVYERSHQDPNRVVDELSKQMIRAVDGVAVTWDGVPGDGNVEQWWAEVGERVRGLLNKIFLQTHQLGREETRRFFEHCIAVRSTST